MNSRKLGIFFLLVTFSSVAQSAYAQNGGGGGGNGSKPHYRVLTFATDNFLNVYANATGTFYAGFFIDLLDRVADLAGFTYTLTISSDLSYGTLQSDGTFDGLIGQLIAGNADIIGPDLVPTPDREAAVDFTAPYYQGKLQLLVRADTNSSNVNYVILNSAATREFLSGSKQPGDQAIWSNIQQNMPSSMVSTYEACAARVRSGGWACLTTTPHIDSFVLGSNGLLIKLPDVFQQWFYGFAVKLGSPLRKSLSVAILKLGFTGVLDSLLQVWFPQDALCGAVG